MTTTRGVSLPSTTSLRARLLSWALCGLALFSAASAWGKDADVVINEIMYHPPHARDDLQYIELFNRGPDAVNLSGWQFQKGVKFTFPAAAQLQPGGYLVVCHDPSAFTAQYGPNVPKIGPFTGRLSHRSERIELANKRGELIDAVKYDDSDDWPRGADGYSSSLERISPISNATGPENWAASNWPLKKGAAGTPGRQNDVFSTNLPPVVKAVQFTPKNPSATDSVKVTAVVSGENSVSAVAIVWRLAVTGRESEERLLPMTRVSGDASSGTYEATIAPQAQGQLVRFRIRAVDDGGTERWAPSMNEPTPSFSYFSFPQRTKATIPQGVAINVGRMERGPAHYQATNSRRPPAPAYGRGHSAFVYIPAEGGEPETFDYVRVIARHGGYKVHFQKDRPLKGMTGINVISEGPLRWIVSEPLAYVLYRMAGVPCPLTEHLRLTLDGRLLGYQLLIEQPNKSFLARNERDPTGNVYKLIWYGRGVIGQHEKKTNPGTGHGDLIEAINGLRQTRGAEQWAFIDQHFNVDECINYYAVNMCIQNWDGFFNNYYAVHNPGPTGKWEIFPWDEDKTWGDYDGASSSYDWYDMPLTFGMNGDRSPNDFRRFGGGPFNGVSWWRPPGYFSGPLLANPEFRRRFLARLNELCQEEFTPANFDPIIDAMEKRLQPEVRLRAQATGQNVNQALRVFASDMQSFRNQVQNRRKVILQQLAKTR